MFGVQHSILFLFMLKSFRVNYSCLYFRIVPVLEPKLATNVEVSAIFSRIALVVVAEQDSATPQVTSIFSILLAVK